MVETIDPAVEDQMREQPGEILREEYMEPLDLSRYQVAPSG